jgi:hypothetical protein
MRVNCRCCIGAKQQQGILEGLNWPWFCHRVTGHGFVIVFQIYIVAIFVTPFMA